MKGYFKIFFVSVLSLSFLTACAATQEVKTSITSTVSSLTSEVDPAVASQIPADKKEGFPQAEAALNIATQKVKLAGKKGDLASAQKKYAELEEDLAGNFQREAKIDYDLVKIEAIMKIGLGKAEDNPKIKANLQSKKLKAQADRIKINAELEAAKGKINFLISEVNKMEEATKKMESEGGKAPAAAPEPTK